jgi:hypothetical protein
MSARKFTRLNHPEPILVVELCEYLPTFFDITDDSQGRLSSYYVRFIFYHKKMYQDILTQFIALAESIVAQRGM